MRLICVWCLGVRTDGVGGRWGFCERERNVREAQSALSAAVFVGCIGPVVGHYSMAGLQTVAVGWVTRLGLLTLGL
jgi:hypothetical protein